MNNYEWLATFKANCLHLARNDDNACNYTTAKEWIEKYKPEDFKDTSPDLIQQMKDTNTIWRLQIYPRTPNGFYFWFGPTLDSVIEQARTSGVL